ncbi:MAG: GH116 family glycosyl hydrolase, partial [Ferruginibacter sp.]
LTKDSVLDPILRWYLTPAMILTKCTKNGNVLNMGYSELNQRDSYWTSWMHLVLFPAGEKKMIEESIAAERDNGKIPTTILPIIEREDDLDINAFFVLRFFRYVNYYKDSAFAKQHWGKVKAAMDWLVSRDQSGEGLPQQKSLWADWKDVKGVEGRKYSPFASFVYLAALKECVNYTANINEISSEKRYMQLYQKGINMMNRKDTEGGLWTGAYYRQVWYDNRLCDKILQDQMVGVFFDIVEKGKAISIVETLNKNNLTAYGVAETFPYYPKDFGYNPAEYHNGGVWPWLNFVDIWCRLKLNRKSEAIDLL